jgi:hypothetical protein
MGSRHEWHEWRERGRAGPGQGAADARSMQLPGEHRARSTAPAHLHWQLEVQGVGLARLPAHALQHAAFGGGGVVQHVCGAALPVAWGRGGRGGAAGLGRAGQGSAGTAGAAASRPPRQLQGCWPGAGPGASQAPGSSPFTTTSCSARHPPHPTPSRPFRPTPAPPCSSSRRQRRPGARRVFQPEAGPPPRPTPPHTPSSPQRASPLPATHRCPQRSG